MKLRKLLSGVIALAVAATAAASVGVNIPPYIPPRIIIGINKAGIPTHSLFKVICTFSLIGFFSSKTKSNFFAQTKLIIENKAVIKKHKQ